MDTPPKQPAHTCRNCAKASSCPLLAGAPAILAAQNASYAPVLALPMPCGGDLWEQRLAPGLLSKKAFANYSQRPRTADKPKVGGLDELLP